MRNSRSVKGSRRSRFRHTMAPFWRRRPGRRARRAGRRLGRRGGEPDLRGSRGKPVALELDHHQGMDIGEPSRLQQRAVSVGRETRRGSRSGDSARLSVRAPHRNRRPPRSHGCLRVHHRSAIAVEPVRQGTAVIASPTAVRDKDRCSASRSTRRFPMTMRREH